MIGQFEMAEEKGITHDARNNKPTRVANEQAQRYHL